MTVVLDASALLAFLHGAVGSDVVEELLSDDARCAAVNWAEVAQKIRASGADWSLARALLLSYGLQVEASTVGDAEWAAARWRRGDGLSLADRFCLALTARLAVPVWTADGAWGTEAPVRQLRMRWAGLGSMRPGRHGRSSGPVHHVHAKKFPTTS